MKKSWSDQPDVCRFAEKIFSCFINAAGSTFEVRKSNSSFDNSYYLTIGNLFGSETVKVNSAEETFRLMEISLRHAINRKDSEDRIKLPDFAELIDA